MKNKRDILSYLVKEYKRQSNANKRTYFVAINLLEVSIILPQMFWKKMTRNFVIFIKWIYTGRFFWRFRKKQKKISPGW